MKTNYFTRLALLIALFSGGLTVAPAPLCHADVGLDISARKAVGAKHWAYIPPVRHPLPAVKLKGWARNPIDRFILARLEKEGLKPSPEASKEMLIRRVSLDLTGLPPTIAEIDAFLADRSPNAYEKVVDRLLAGPHFGERWARPWLDLARYADSNGYEKDARRTIWPYRDWVIHAFNKDMPFDQFTIDQIAGDMLPNATLDDKIATGFHRNTLYNEEGGVDRDEQRWLTIVDRVSTTASVWLGTTLGCAQCHNHKYDPFTMRDYYSFFAFFDHCDEPALPAETPETAAKRAALDAEAAALTAKLKALPPGTDKATADLLTAQIADKKHAADALRGPTTLVMQERPGTEIPTTFMRVKGGFLAKADQVSAAVPASLTPLPAGKPINRLTLAAWLVSEDNPLTARVTVNRLWEQLFGRGIVETSEDFGTQGSPPSHPELLDWLAVEFVHPTIDSAASASRPAAVPWTMKRMLRLMVTSATYRQSSHVTATVHELDPANRLLARGPRFRMEAEMIRDTSLSAGGLLSLTIGGPSVFPVQPEGIWAVPYNGDLWVTSPGEERYRRGLYTFIRRSAPYPEFLSFDATSREFCTVRRIRTTSPLQALTTLNDPAFFDAARGLARRMQIEGGSDVRARLTFGFRCCTARRPEASELNRLTALYAQQLARYRSDAKSAAAIAGGAAGRPDLAETAALTIVSNVLLNLDETLTKE